jgi:hypothetical protein
MKTAVLCCALALLAVAGDAAAQTAPPKAPRLALVIGNGAYKDAPLPNPVNDAADMARALEASGFTVIKRENASLKEMHLALREFGDRLGRQSTGLFYFAGHGLQVRGRNYLLPVDADIAREDEVAFASLDLAAVMEKLDSAKNPVNLVVLDACRNNPFGNRLTASARGLAQVEAPPGTLIAFSTAPGSTAADGSGRNGLYTEHLVKQIPVPGAAVEEVFKAVRASVRIASKGAQIPWESTSLESAFRFHAARVDVAAAAPAKVGAAPATAPRSAQAISVRAPPSYQVGDTWTYRIVNLLDQSERKNTLKVAEIRGDEVHFNGGSVTDIFGNQLKTVRGGDRTDEYIPSMHNYVFPLKKGNVFNFKVVQKSAERTYDLQEKVTVGDEEELEAGGQKLRAVKLTREIRWKQRNSSSAGTNHLTYWYNATAKRHLVMEQRNVQDDGKVLSHERQELVDYKVK